MVKKKKAQSEIVGTVLLILITIVVGGLIAAFVVPFVRDKLPEQNQNCLDVVGKVRISSGYTCYNTTFKNQSVQIHIDDIRSSIKGFKVELGGPSSKAVNILEDDHAGVYMYAGASFSIPNNTEERTYLIPSTTTPTYISVHAVLKNGKLCDASDTINEIENC